MTTTLGIATITVIAAVGNPRPTPGSSKKIMLDAQIYVSSSNCELLLGTLSYFNGSDMVFWKDDIALYLLYAMVSLLFHFIFQLLKCFSLRLLKGRMAHKYTPLQTQRRNMILLVTFNGSVIFPLFNALLNIISDPQIVPLTPLSSDCDNNTSFSIDPAQHAYLHILGVAVNCNEKEATFDVEIDQYISTLKDVKSSPSKFVTPFSCSIPDSPRYKTGKPVPYNRQYISISGFLTDVTYKPDSDVMQRFHLKVENIVFLSQQCNVMGTIPNSLDSAFFFSKLLCYKILTIFSSAPSRTPHTGKGLIDYKCKAPASPTTPTPVQGPPKKHCHLESKGSHSTVPPQFNWPLYP